MKPTKHIAVLGATGSIGRQTLDVIQRSGGKYKADVLTAGGRVDDLIALSLVHKPSLVIIADETKYKTLHDALEPHGIATACGPEALRDAATMPQIDVVLTATVGYSGLEPTIAAIKSGKDIALANKETLVVAGALINKLLQNSSSRIFPVDSEHSAISQCLQGEDSDSVRRLLITASGGPFRTWSAEKIAKATKADALKHPNWNMGAKITIDSATMLNKAFEIIEARWLFGIDSSRIEALVHPQSIIHSMVEFVDGSVKAQLGTPDMRLPIAYALGENSRSDYDLPRLTLHQLSNLTFEKPDPEKFPCLQLAYEALDKGGNTACIINAANEIAVAAFLKDEIRFVDIYAIIEDALSHVPYIAEPAYEDYVSSNAAARLRAEEMTGRIAFNR